MTIWRDTCDTAEVCFAGKGERLPVGRGVAWLEQVHGGLTRRARSGWSGRGDALVSARPEIAPIVVTADCVPVLLAGQHSVAAVHAGWRGIAREILPSAAAAMVDDPPRTAWIGPAIGRCCYQVSDAVAREVVAMSSERALHLRPGARPHLDLAAAVSAQLERLQIDDVRRIDRCTRCHPAELWSYRRDGAGAGRNLAMIWLTDVGGAAPAVA